LITLRLYESDNNSGEFWAYVPSTLASTAQNDKRLTVGANTQLTATYIDTLDAVDGFSTFPAEVVSGETARDSSGLAYEVGAGEFRYPIVEEGRYVVRVDPPEGFRFASIIPAEDLVELNDGSFVIMDASFGKDYVLNADGPLRFDIPLDPDTDLVLSKTADRTFGDVGDFVNYTVTIENRGVGPARPTLLDTLPIGFTAIRFLI